MRLSYLDTSATMKLLFEEAESQSLADVVADQHGPALVSSWLLHTELHCASRRRGGANPDAIAMVLDAVNLVDVTRGTWSLPARSRLRARRMPFISPWRCRSG